MKTVAMYKTRDGKVFPLESDAKRHAEERYGAEVTKIANTLRDAFTFGDAAEGIGHYCYTVRELENFHAMFSEAVAWKRDRELESHDEDGE